MSTYSYTSGKALPATQSSPYQTAYIQRDPQPMVYAPPQQQTVVTMYTTQYCGYCQQARTYLNAKRIPYIDYDVHNTEQGKRFSETDHSGVPVIFICGQRMDGWGEANFQAYYARCQVS